MIRKYNGWLAAALLLAAMCLLASCAQAQGKAHLTVNRNGTADLNLDMSVSNEALNLLGQPDLIPQLISKLQAQGLDAQSYTKDGSTGLTASRSFQLKNMGISGVTAKLPDGLEAEHSSEESFFYTKEHIAVTVDMEKLMASSSDAAGQQLSAMNPLVKGLVQSQIKLQFLLTAPVKAGASNANEIQDHGRTLVWDIKLFEPNRFEVDINVPNIRHIAYTGGAVLIIIIAAVWLAVRTYRKRRRSA
ncbi:DUF3153 domain-containing protein [Paenibacillus protaetiae]|uniref:DUF3153 domain-containing protein n=1 Tax=Paenibacillus protaetiae TaxID=2509456 RepID=A0A4P6EXN9_9BACL|nr:DUF3153 domain-containing protein [Paenibacillus protaetiae]QAY66509.1 hypothetical protein ET464_08885 [Paenibacillus protaetiae]